MAVLEILDVQIHFFFKFEVVILGALQIAGDKDEKQILLALQMYSHRAGLLQAVLNESYQLYRFGHNLVFASLVFHSNCVIPNFFLNEDSQTFTSPIFMVFLFMFKSK